MLAGIEETVHAREPPKVSQATTAIESLLAGLIDYAGLYPPASLDMCSAVENYLAYRSGKYAHALGRFIVDVNRIDELCAAAGDDLRDLRLSVIVPPESNGSCISELLKDGLRIEAIETKPVSLRDLDQIDGSIPPNAETYIELPIDSVNGESLAQIAATGARVKLRMGGVVAEAFPAPEAVARALAALAEHGLAFKATAGLHHPIRSRHVLTYAQGSPTGIMHGFINLVCAIALLHSGGAVAEATALLEEQDPGAWHLTPQALAWRSHSWSTDHLSETRKIFVSFGSCSFAEPILDLEALGWL